MIPARFGSQRFPGKPLAKIAGKPLLQWVIEGAKTAKSISEIVVATDHQEIAALAKQCGVAAAMTASEIPSGSDRAWAAAQERVADVVVNIQGDEPLITGRLLDGLTEPFFSDKNLEMATLGRPLKTGDLESQSTAKIVLNKKGEALYFSRLPIPYSRMSVDASLIGAVCLKHIGLYAFKKAFLQTFCENGPTALEQAESLEQLRALYLGARIRVVQVDHESWGVDTPEDIAKIEELLRIKR